MPSATARKKYPAQIVIVTTDEVNDRIREKAAADGVSIAEVARGYLEAGIAAEDERERHEQMRTAALGQSLITREAMLDTLAAEPPATRPAVRSSSEFTL